MRWYLALLENSSYERSFVLHLAYRERSAEQRLRSRKDTEHFQSEPIMCQECKTVLTIIQPVNHKVHMEYKYSKTLLGTPTPLPGQTCAIIV